MQYTTVLELCIIYIHLSRPKVTGNAKMYVNNISHISHYT